MEGIVSRTTMLLQGTSTYFDRVQRERIIRRERLGSSSGPQTPASSDSRFPKRIGLAPWHRRNSHDSLLSASSSIRGLLMGRTPSATPIPERQYAGAGGKQYPRGDLKSKNQQSFAQANVLI